MNLRAKLGDQMSFINLVMNVFIGSFIYLINVYGVPTMYQKLCRDYE